MTLIRNYLTRFAQKIVDQENAKIAGLPPIKPKSVLPGTPDAMIAEISDLT
jgi:hypothetical protein